MMGNAAMPASTCRAAGLRVCQAGLLMSRQAFRTENKGSSTRVEVPHSMGPAALRSPRRKLGTEFPVLQPKWRSGTRFRIPYPALQAWSAGLRLLRQPIPRSTMPESCGSTHIPQCENSIASVLVTIPKVKKGSRVFSRCTAKPIQRQLPVSSNTLAEPVHDS
jgi:hypothetical protein